MGFKYLMDLVGSRATDKRFYCLKRKQSVRFHI